MEVLFVTHLIVISFYIRKNLEKSREYKNLDLSLDISKDIFFLLLVSFAQEKCQQHAHHPVL